MAKTKTVTVKAAVDDGGYVKGYASTWTRQPDWAGDVVAKGAFSECIERMKANGEVIPLLFSHNNGNIDDYIGRIDLLEEDDHGLLFGGPFDNTEKAQRARQLVMDGRLSKVSFAYDILDQGPVELENGVQANELRKLNIHEVSLCLIPANPDTSIVEVKGGEPDVKDGEPESKAGRRNSAKDADDLNAILDHARSIQSIVNGLLAETRQPDEQESGAEADAAKANAEEQKEANEQSEEPTEANAEEPEAKSADVDALLEEANQLLSKEA